MEDDGKVVDTRSGPKSLGDIRRELTAPSVGYNGPMDEASVRGAYERAAPGGGGGTAPGGPPGFSSAAASAADAAVANWIAWMRLNLVDVRSLDLQEARDVWKRAYDQATLSGYNPTPSYAGGGQKVLDALGVLRSNAQYQQAVAAGDGETARSMEANTVAQTLGMDPGQARVAIDRLRAMTASTGQPSSAQLVEQVLGQVPGTPTLERERLQNQTTTDTLRILSGLRGPENAFAYAETLQNIPPSIRANIQAAMGRLPLTAQNPAQAGMLGDVGVYGQGAGAPVGYPAATGPRTAQALPAGSRWQATQPMGGQPAFNPAAQQAAQQRAAARGWEINYPTTQPGMVANQYATAAYGPRTSPAVAAGMTAPSQLSPTDMNRLGTYGQKLLWAGYEHAGEDPGEVQDQFRRSLPTATGPRTSTYRAA